MKIPILLSKGFGGGKFAFCSFGAENFPGCDKDFLPFGPVFCLT